MRIGYFGSPEISARLLERLIEDPAVEVSFVVTNPDSARGRSKKLWPTPVAELALGHGENEVPTYRFESLKGSEVEEALRRHSVDLYVVFAYGRLLPEDLLKTPRLGCINLHASLLPLLRGASPIQSAVLQGFKNTGWTVQEMAKEMDAGDVLSQVELAVDPNETAGELTERMLPRGIELIQDTIHRLAEGPVQAAEQDNNAATYCGKLGQQDAWIDWNDTAVGIHNRVRGMNPSPVARTTLEGRLIKILRTAHLDDDLLASSELPDWPPGRVGLVRSESGPKFVARTGNGALEILQLQPEGKKVMDGKAFANGLRGPGPHLLSTAAR